MNDLHDDITELSTDLNDEITKVKNSTKIIVPMTYSGVGISSSNNNTITFTQNKDGSTHIMLYHAVGSFGVGFKLSNTYLEYKNRKLDIYVKSPNDVSFTARLYIDDSAWGEVKHKGNVSDPNTSNGYVAAVSSTGVRINNDCCKFTIGTDTDTFWDNDNFCLLLDTTPTYGDYEMDILITDSTDNFDIPEKPIKTGGYIELKNRFSKATLYYADMPSHTNIINTIPSENRNHIFINKYQTDFTNYSFVFTPYTIENTDITRLWIYDIFFIKITDFIGKNYSVKISIYSNDSKIDYINHAHITTDVVSWANNVKTLQSETISSKCKIINFNTKDVLNTIDESKSYYICIGYDSNHYPDADRNIIYSRDTTIDVDIEIVDLDNTKIIATELIDFDKSKYYTKSEINEMINIPTKYITCWGDSLTEGGGWTSRLQELTGMTVYNGGTGGESSKTICSRQGADAMVVNNITIPADTSNVLIASRTDDIGITTVEGNKVTPLLQGGSHVNPCKIGDIEGTLRWTGSNYADTSGTWVFKRSTAGDSSITINRPTVLRTNYDMNRNNPYLMIIFIGQNGGWDNDLDTLVRQHRLMIEHANAEHVIILGLSSGNTSTRTEYETRMKQEFGRYFISLREYLSTPIYENGEIVSCYGIEDQNAEIDMDYVATNASGKTVKQEITDGIVPHAILTDGVHYTSETKTVIGDLIYKRCKELNIF